MTSAALGSRLSGAAFIASLLADVAEARTWTVLVGGNGDAPTIQAAVDSCAPNDSVLVGAGTFVESVSVDVPLSLIGLGPDRTSTISAGGAEYCVGMSVAIDPLVIKSLTLVDASPQGAYGYGGFVVYGGGSLRMTDCRITDTGIHRTRGVEWGGPARIQGCEFTALNTAHVPVVFANGSLFEIDQTIFRDCGQTAILAGAEQTRVTGCRFERVRCDGAAIGIWGPLEASNNVFVDIDYGGAAIGPYRPPVSRRPRHSLVPTLSVHDNTFVRAPLGAIEQFDQVEIVSFRNNIVSGGVFGVRTLPGIDDPSAIACNDVWNNQSNWVGHDFAAENGNISEPPRWCDPGNGDFTLAANSPCLPANNSCGELIGALGQGCAATAVEPRSWGAIKALYR